MSVRYEMTKAKVTVLMMAVGMLVLTGCSSATVYQMASGERSAGAEGTVTLEQDDNGNFLGVLEIAHAPLPSQLDDQSSVYVLWMQPEDANERYNMGKIRLDPGDRTGELIFTTPFSGFDLWVTAEPHGSETAPSDEVVLRYTR